MLPTPEPEQVGEAVEVGDQFGSNAGTGILQGDEAAFAAAADGAGQVEEGVSGRISRIRPALEPTIAGFELVDQFSQCGDFIWVNKLAFILLAQLLVVGVVGRQFTHHHDQFLLYAKDLLLYGMVVGMRAADAESGVQLIDASIGHHACVILGHAFAKE